MKYYKNKDVIRNKYAYINKSGYYCVEHERKIIFYLNGSVHRVGKPAFYHFIHKSKAYFINNKLHRKDGPAVIYDNGIKYFWLHGECFNDFYKLNCPEKESQNLFPTNEHWVQYQRLMVFL